MTENSGNNLIGDFLFKKAILYKKSILDSLPAKQSIAFARATITRTMITTIMTMMTMIPTVKELVSAAERQIKKS